MADAEKKPSLLNDHYARRFMDSHGLSVFSRLKHLDASHMCSIVRAKLIDDQLKKILSGDQSTQVVVLGAGFDTKAFRLGGGTWIEIDDPAIIKIKNQELPVSSCTNPLARMAVDFSRDELALALQEICTEKKTVFIIEGVFMYLDESEIKNTLGLLKARFPEHDLLVDLMNEHFIKQYMGKYLRAIGEFNCSFKFHHQNPRGLLKELGYKDLLTASIFDHASELGQFWAPRFLLRILRPKLLSGYTVNWMRQDLCE